MVTELDEPIFLGVFINGNYIPCDEDKAKELIASQQK